MASPSLNAPEAGTKRSLPDRETASPDPKIKEEPDVKKQKLDEIKTPAQQSPKIIDIDPAGDLLILFKSKNVAYKVDSNALKRGSPKLYQQCLDVRPADGSAWTFTGVTDAFKEATEIIIEKATEMILNLIHANMNKIPKSMNCAQVHNAVVFAKDFDMLDAFSGSLEKWYQAIPASCCYASRGNLCKCVCLWTTYRLGLEEDFKTFQRWAIFNLHDDGKGALVDPIEQLAGEPLGLSTFGLSDKAVIGKFQESFSQFGEADQICLPPADRLVQVRSKAVDLIVTGLEEVQMAMIPSGQFGKDGRIKNKFGGCGCSKCLDLWFGCIAKSRLRPDLLDSAIWRDFPKLSAKEYHQPLERLCEFVTAIQAKMTGYVACNRKGQACCPPQLIGRKAVEDLVTQGLQAPLGAT